MVRRILVLDASLDRTFYRPTEHWAQYLGDVAFDSVDVPGGESIPSLDQYTHLLLTGSSASFEEPESWFDDEASAVRDAIARDMSVLGSCFGHQMLVWALSGPQFVRRAPIPELGWISVRFLESDDLLAEIQDPWHAFASHLDEVVDPPAPWRVLAANEACSVQAVRYGDRPVWGIQPHPEIDPSEAKRLMEVSIERQPEFAAAIRAAMKAPVREDGVTPRLVKAFLSSRVRRGGSQ